MRATAAVPQPTTSTEPTRAAPTRTSGATIGPSIVVKGEVTGEEDLFIHGQVDGSVALGPHAVTVGNVGRVKANITGRVITVEGAVEGNLRAQEQIILRGSAQVLGDLEAPRIVLEDGATFRGLIDMGAPKASPSATAAKAGGRTQTQSPVESTSRDATKADSGSSREAPRTAAPSGSKTSPSGAGA